MRFFSSHGKPPCPNNSSSPIHFSLSNVLYEKFRRITKIQRSKAFVKYRIQNEIRNTKLNPPTHISYGKVVDHDYFHFQGAIIGPCDTPFEGGVFFVSIKMPYNYPFKPPKVVFLTKVFHPNISEDGTIHIDFLGKTWGAAWTIEKILLGLCSFLDDPDPEDLLNPISYLYQNHRETYNKIAREWTKKYAMP
ncbi:hypothetical protein CsatB_025407 [Cannabis sativa]|uniref:UBC core domain-containing protein n=1 Tax=Cannabis sativa TaxID=3483 RepID=A0A7J6FV71_CANSA|nr:uncharacterized protein LOC115722611 [Cannabis sativa]KAF4355297.1 hypothetical protein F8388_026567 [Cannabis sativa]KAF4374654.1 hypothetical protein G4B88_004906 [Cannabis sativa]